MRIVSGVLFVLLALFAAAQYNDPDPLLWGGIYGGAAAWAGLGAIRPGLLGAPRVSAALAASVALALALAVWFWPQAEGWWLREVWWEDEAAREGMGLMIVFGALAFVGLQALAVRRPAR